MAQGKRILVIAATTERDYQRETPHWHLSIREVSYPRQLPMPFHCISTVRFPRIGGTIANMRRIALIPPRRSSVLPISITSFTSVGLSADKPPLAK